MTLEQLERRRQRNREYMREYRKKYPDKYKQRYRSDEAFREKRLADNRQYHKDPQVKERCRKRQAQRYHSDSEHREKSKRAAQARRDTKSRLLRHMQIVDGCQHCGCRGADVLQWHHVDPATKFKPISEMGSYSWSKIMDEVEKCIVLCEDCHRDVHGKDWVDIDDLVMETQLRS